MKYQTLVDVHTHTTVSGHAYSSLQEMAQEASRRGLEILGITEHAPELPGAPDPIYFRNLHVVPRQFYGLRLLLGAELNILDTQGHLSLNEDYYRRLDLCIAGIHTLCWQGGTREENTQAVLRVMHNPWIHIISHPADGAADLDFVPLVEAVCSTHTLLEINNSSLLPIRGNKVATENTLQLLRLCSDRDVPILLSSDAHFSLSIGSYDYLWPLLEETQFPRELILNHQPQAFLDFLQIP